MYELHRDPDKRKEPFTPEDFLSGGEPERAQTPEEQLAIVTLWNAALGGETIQT